jgi:hypothetical protein
MLVRGDLTERVIGLAVSVHGLLRSGLLQYRESLSCVTARRWLMLFVIPAQAGIQSRRMYHPMGWIPAFAGMTINVLPNGLTRVPAREGTNRCMTNASHSNARKQAFAM